MELGIIHPRGRSDCVFFFVHCYKFTRLSTSRRQTLRKRPFLMRCQLCALREARCSSINHYVNLHPHSHPYGWADWLCTTKLRNYSETTKFFNNIFAHTQFVCAHNRKCSKIASIFSGKKNNIVEKENPHLSHRMDEGGEDRW